MATLDPLELLRPIAPLPQAIIAGRRLQRFGARLLRPPAQRHEVGQAR